MLKATLYSRPGCHLCEVLKGKLHWIGRDDPLDVHEIDVSGDASLEARYGHRVPVLTIDGIEIAEGVVTDDELRRRLAGRR